MQVEHQLDKRRFVIRFGEEKAVLDYVLSGNNINFHHTYVPFALRGKGYAEELVKAGLAWAREQSHEIEASCWYVNKFLA